jgi:hypothetical protein
LGDYPYTASNGWLGACFAAIADQDKHQHKRDKNEFTLVNAKLLFVVVFVSLDHGMNPPAHDRRWLRWGCLFVALLTLASHWPGVYGQFVDWDDASHITGNPAIRALTSHNLWLILTEPTAKLYIPLTWFSFAADYQVWGRDPFGYHFTNLVLHLANTLLALVFVYRILRGRCDFAAPVAVLTAAIFGVHPLRVESVAWATERKDVLFAFFFLLALLAYLHWVGEGKRSTWWACLLLFIASALSKSTAVTFPVVLLLMDAFLFRRRAFGEKMPLFIVGLIIGAATFVAQATGKGETVATANVIPVWGRIGLVGYCAFFYIRKFFWPFHLSAVYPTFDELGWDPMTAVAYAFGFVAVTTAVVILRRRAPVLLPSWLWYLITLSPTIGLVPVGIHVVADRFSYLPLLGLALPLSFGLVAAARALGRLHAAAGLACGACGPVLLLGLVLLTTHRTRVWRNTETLFQNALAENPNCLPALVNLTAWYTDHKQYDKAIAHGRRAMEVAPNGLPGRKNLAYALINAGRQREAISVLRTAIGHEVDDADVWRALGECFMAEHDWKNAGAALQGALRHTGADKGAIQADLAAIQEHLDPGATAH